MKKHLRLTTFLLFILIFFTSFTPVNASNDKKEVSKEVKAYMSAVKRYNKSKIQSTLVNKKFDYWNGSTKLQQHIKKLNKKYLKYEIKSVKVKGDSATAILKVSFYSAYDDSKHSMKDAISIYGKNITGEKMLKAYAKGLEAQYKQNILYFENPEEFKDQFIFTNTTKIPLKKVDGKWKVKEVTSKMQYQMDCVTSDFISDFSNNPFIIYS